MVCQMYMNGAHNGDQFIQRGYEYWMRQRETDLDHWAALHGADPDTFGAVLQRTRKIECRP
jgi:hypothetical protein